KEYSGELYLVPKREKKEGLWAIPENIGVTELPKKWKRPGKITRVCSTLLSTLFIKECFYLLFRRKTVNLSFYKTAFSATHEVFMYKRRLAALIDQEKDKPVVIYSYWFNQISYSATLLKRQRPNLKVVARAVSKDLYEFRSPKQYLPLKRQFKNRLDKIYTISNEGADYMKAHYGFPDHNLEISRQGINIDATTYTQPSQTGHVVLLSVAVFKSLKRIDKIIKAIGLFAEKHPQITITW